VMVHVHLSVAYQKMDSPQKAQNALDKARSLAPDPAELKNIEKELELVGVGYRANMSGKNLVLNVGYSHPVEITPPDGITFDVAGDSRKVTVSGHDKQQVGQIAADIRKVRPPEPYKGKGIRYKGEHVRRKAGKVGKVM